MPSARGRPETRSREDGSASRTAAMGSSSGSIPGRGWADEGTDAFRQVGDQRNELAPETIAGLARAALGDRKGALEVLRGALARAERIGQPFPISYVKIHLAFVLIES